MAALLAVLFMFACGQDDTPRRETPTSQAQSADDAMPDSSAAPALQVPAIYQSVCAACHTEGVAGAPRLGNREDWRPHLTQGEAALMQSVMQGKGSMPVKGTVLDASEEELRATVRYMVQHAQ